MSAAFIQRLLVVAPELGPIYDEHMQSNYDELLPYLFMGDVTRFLIEVSGERAAKFSGKKILDYFESELASGDESVDALIYLGFCENLLGEERALTILRPQMGECLATAMKKVSGE
jgi:hypothetical protein